MAEKFDVASRLAEGRPAVDNIQTYVWACHMLGYANPDLTLHAAQVRDWYGSEDGLDLRALDARSCGARSGRGGDGGRAGVPGRATRRAVGGVAGRAARTSRVRSCAGTATTSAAAAAAVRKTADALASLRDNLWHAVDGKVAAAIAADDRAPDEWLAAAHTVTTGAGDRASASERIDQQVKPFVDNDIRADWLTAMRSAIAAVTDLYDAVTAELNAAPGAVFDVPGALGPSWTPPPSDDQAATVPAAASVASPPVIASPTWSAPAATPPMPAPAAFAPMSAAPLAPPVDAGSTAPAMAAPPSAPSLGGMPDVGSGLSGLGQQLADVFGSLLGSVDDGLGRRPTSTRRRSTRTLMTNSMTTPTTATMSLSSPPPMRKNSPPPRTLSRNLFEPACAQYGEWSCSCVLTTTYCCDRPPVVAEPGVRRDRARQAAGSEERLLGSAARVGPGRVDHARAVPRAVHLEPPDSGPVPCGHRRCCCCRAWLSVL